MGPVSGVPVFENRSGPPETAFLWGEGASALILPEEKGMPL